jgi:hypothetical protein
VAVTAVTPEPYDTAGRWLAGARRKGTSASSHGGLLDALRFCCHHS